jgi:LeuA allosteric (dimerisation) domain
MTLSYYIDPSVNQFNGNGIKYESNGNGIIPLMFQYLKDYYHISREYLIPHFSISNQCLGTDAVGFASIAIESTEYFSMGIGNSTDTMFAIFDALKQGFEQINSGEFTNEIAENVPPLIMRDFPKRFSLSYYRIMGILGQGAFAIITLFDNESEKYLNFHGIGNGGLDAACDAINRAVRTIMPFDLLLVKFNVNTLEESEFAPGRASIIIQNSQGSKFMGQVTDSNILVAAISAYVDAINDYCYPNNQTDCFEGWYQGV